MGRTFEKGKKYEFARIVQVPQQVLRPEAFVVASGEVEESLDDCILLKGGMRVMRSAFEVAVELKEPSE